ncbi:MAG: phospho-N-acetylmuramoyl-pentapeptide-transferase [Myxococcota bacterium]
MGNRAAREGGFFWLRITCRDAINRVSTIHDHKESSTKPGGGCAAHQGTARIALPKRLCATMHGDEKKRGSLKITLMMYLLPPFGEAGWTFYLLNSPLIRALLAAATALITCLLLGSWAIAKLQALRLKQTVRDDGPRTHLAKQGTPTMGGLLVLGCITLACLVWADPACGSVWLMMIVIVGFGAVGLYDDFQKIRRQNTRGLSARGKLIWMFGIGGLAVFAHAAGFSGIPFATHLTIPLMPAPYARLELPLWLYLPFALTLLVGTANAVNLTDGLDGLAVGTIFVGACAFLVLTQTASVSGGNAVADASLTNGSRIAELAVPCGAIVGACLGFFKYNRHPARVFLGDVGSLALGGALGLLPILTKHELLTAILHGVFLAEALSVMAQVAAFKLTGKRVLRMAPLHHHLELSGWPETRVVTCLWAVSALLAALALLSTLLH